MSENRYYKEALSNFTSEVAFAGAVRHLYDLGYSVEMIRNNLTYPVSCEQIRKVIEEYEEKKKNPRKDYEYVQDIDAYGRKSYRKVEKHRNLPT